MDCPADNPGELIILLINNISEKNDQVIENAVLLHITSVNQHIVWK